MSTTYDLVGGVVVDPATCTATARDLHVRDGRFASRAGQAALTATSARGLYILPGLVEMHAHVVPTLVGGRHISDAVLEPTREKLRQGLRAGVTTFRDLGGPLAELLALRSSLEGGPRLLVAGPVLTAPGGHGMHSGHGIATASPDDARAIVSTLHTAGVDHLKIVTSGARGQNQLGVDTFDSIVEAAEEFGLAVAVHAHFQLDWLRRSADAGVRSIEHGFLLHQDPRIIDVMVQNGVALCPTLRVVEAIREDPGWYGQELIPGAWPDALASVAHAARSGARLVAGTDYGVYGVGISDVWREIDLIAKAAGSRWMGLQAATSAAADVLGRPDLGSFADGASADFVVVDADPLTTALTADNVVAVGFEGVIHPEASLSRARIAE